MTATQGTRRIRRIVASVLVVAMLAGAIVIDQAGLGSRSERYAGSPAYAYLTETMECLSYGWLHWIGYWLGAQFSDADSASGQYRRACVAVAQGDFADAEQWLQARIASGAGASEAESAALRMQLGCVRSLEASPAAILRMRKRLAAYGVRGPGRMARKAPLACS